MLGDISAASEIYLVCGYTDMRKSIDGLRAIVEGTLKLDSKNHSLFPDMFSCTNAWMWRTGDTVGRETRARRGI